VDANGFVEGVSEKGFAHGSSDVRVSHDGRAGVVDWESRLAKDASSSMTAARFQREMQKGTKVFRKLTVQLRFATSYERSWHGYIRGSWS